MKAFEVIKKGNISKPESRSQWHNQFNNNETKLISMFAAVWLLSKVKSFLSFNLKRLQTLLLLYVLIIAMLFILVRAKLVLTTCNLFRTLQLMFKLANDEHIAPNAVTSLASLRQLPVRFRIDFQNFIFDL